MTWVGRPRRGSSTVVVVCPSGLVTSVPVATSPVAGVYAVVVVLPYASVAASARP
ncbi:hypothetical protein [Streptomyces sp. NPDC006645]|uniref:hypothetical protein n=1 Tax=unclassified Streptomyces TaxID=2593676 RepID=UPI0033B2E5A1